MGILEFLLALSGSKKNTNKNKEQSGFDWETHCESCGELLEDCECDDKELSMEDIALMDMLDEEDEMEEKA